MPVRVALPSMFARWPALPSQAFTTAAAEPYPMATFSAAEPPDPRAALIAAARASNPSCPNGTAPDAMFRLWPFACSQIAWFFARAGFPMLRRWLLTSWRISSS